MLKNRLSKCYSCGYVRQKNDAGKVFVCPKCGKNYFFTRHQFRSIRSILPVHLGESKKMSSYWVHSLVKGGVFVSIALIAGVVVTKEGYITREDDPYIFWGGLIFVLILIYVSKRNYDHEKSRQHKILEDMNKAREIDEDDLRK